MEYAASALSKLIYHSVHPILHYTAFSFLPSVRFSSDLNELSRHVWSAYSPANFKIELLLKPPRHYSSRQSRQDKHLIRLRCQLSKRRLSLQFSPYPNRHHTSTLTK
jgi:hypothetical protein